MTPSTSVSPVSAGWRLMPIHSSTPRCCRRFEQRSCRAEGRADCGGCREFFALADGAINEMTASGPTSLATANQSEDWLQPYFSGCRDLSMSAGHVSLWASAPPVSSKTASGSPAAGNASPGPTARRSRARRRLLTTNTALCPAPNVDLRKRPSRHSNTRRPRRLRRPGRCRSRCLCCRCYRCKRRRTGWDSARLR